MRLAAGLSVLEKDLDGDVLTAEARDQLLPAPGDPVYLDFDRAMVCGSVVHAEPSDLGMVVVVDLDPDARRAHLSYAAVYDQVEVMREDGHAVGFRVAAIGFHYFTVTDHSSVPQSDLWFAVHD